MTLNPFSDIGWKTSFFGLKRRQGCENWNLRAQRPFRKNFRKKIQFYLSLRNFWRKFWIAQKLGFCQEGLLRLQRSISRKHFLKETKLSLTFGLWTRMFRVSGKTKLTELPKLQSVYREKHFHRNDLCPEIQFQNKIFFSKKKTKYWFYSQTLREKNSGIGSQFLAMGVKPVFYASKDHTETNPEYYLFLIFRNFGENFDLHQKTPDLSRKTLLSRKTTFWEKPIFLLIRLWGKNERLSVEISLAYLPQTHSMRPQKQFEEEDCFCSRKRNFEYFFWLWAENVQSFRKLSPKGVTTELYDSRRYIWKKTSLQEVKFLYLFMVLLRTFWLDGNFHGRQEGILRDQLKGSRKNFWEKPKILEFCEMTEKFQFFGETALAELSKLHSVCPEKHFEKNVLFREKNMTLNLFSDIGWKTMTLGGTLWEKWTFSRKKYDLESIFWHWKKNFLFWPKTSPGVSKLKCMRPKTVLDNFPEKNEFHLSLRNLLRKFWIAQKLGFCQEGNLRLQRNISGKHFLKETKLSLTFGLWTRIFRVSGKTKLTELPKLHSMCQEMHFQKKDIFFR